MTNNDETTALIQADVLRVLKKDYGAKFVLSRKSADSITLIMLNRGEIDSSVGVVRLGAIGNIEYDADGKVCAISCKGFKIILLAKSACG
jgi:hypothetical protein